MKKFTNEVLLKLEQSIISVELIRLKQKFCNFALEKFVRREVETQYHPQYFCLHACSYIIRIMESRVEKAREKKASGKYNCAQAVACTYSDLVGMSPEQIADVTSAFGVGMGNMKGTCGALVGAGVILGLKTGDRVKAMKAMKRVMDKFGSQNSSTVCCELKGTCSGRKLRDCNDCVADAARFLEEEIVSKD